MKLLVYSDLHLEFPQARDRFRVPDHLDFDAVVLAGDIHKHTHGIGWAAANPAFEGKKIFYCSGNHEFYGSHVTRLIAEMRKAARDLGVIFLECDEYIDYEHNVRFLGTTLWTDFAVMGHDAENFCMKEAARSMPDFSTIRISAARTALQSDRYGVLNGNSGGGDWRAGILKPSDTVKIFHRSRDWLASKLDEPFDGKTVVITHHLPSWKLCAERFQKDPISAAFISHLDYLVEKVNGVWVSGHTHDSFSIQLGKCQVVVNPRGYPNEMTDAIENRGFRDDFILEI